MIGILLVLCTLTAHQFETMIVRHYGKKHGKGGMFFNAIICIFATLYFLVTDKGGLQFPPKIWIYGLVNSTMYALGFYAAYVAFKIGSFGMTRLFTSFGVIISTFYGILFLKEPATASTYVALALIIFSLVLMNAPTSTNENKKAFSVKWLMYILLVIISNAAIAIIGRIQFGVFGDAYNNEFLFISLAGASISLLVLSLIFERDTIKLTLKHGIVFGAGAGICNAISNLVGLITYNYLPLSFIAPLKSSLSVILGFGVSIGLYKERFTKLQILSVIIGVLAVVCMNLNF